MHPTRVCFSFSGTPNSSPRNKRRLPQRLLKWAATQTLQVTSSLAQNWERVSETWQVCDVQDTMLRHIVEDATLLPEANMKSGYYSESSMHKLRTIMKQKLAVLREGRIPRGPLSLYKCCNSCSPTTICYLTTTTTTIRALHS